MYTKTDREIKNAIFRAAMEHFKNKHSVNVLYEDEEVFVEESTEFPTLDKALEHVLHVRDAFPGAEITVFHNGNTVDISKYIG